MAAKTSEVFLVSGQLLRRVDGELVLAPEVEQCVVVARDIDHAYSAIAISEPAFRPMGHATLQDYENSATKVRAALGGDDVGWSVLLAPGMALTAVKSQVFLLSGQIVERLVGGGQRLGVVVEHRVVVAPDAVAAYAVVAANAPDFMPSGFVSLDEQERAASKLRAAIGGGDVGWKILVAPGM